MSGALKCPYCGHINYDYEYYESPPETEIEYECHKCEKVFKYYWSQSVEFRVIED